MRVLILLILLSTPAYAYVSNDQAVTVILGAASDESYKEMYAIASALRNKDTTDGVWERVADISNLPESLKAEALRAWKDSENGEDTTLGATGWENDDINGGYIRPGSDELTSRRIPKKEVTVKIGRHTFHK